MPVDAKSLFGSATTPARLPRLFLFRPAAGGQPRGFADVWQYAQSPRRPAYTAQCKSTYAADGNCYAPGLQPQGVHIDLNTATSPDPSHGRTQ